jgi:multidrug efflux pump subunit AcrA (membrane-fusion protein)
VRRHIGVICLGCVLVVIGVASGWFAARQGAADQGAGKAAQAAAPVFSPQTLKNLGVTVGEAKVSTFVRHARVQATVVDAPLNTVPVTVPLGGIVTQLHVAPGRIAKAGAPLVSIARSPIPRPQLSLTADILTPVSENLHEAISKLRTAVAQHKIVTTELDRVRRFTETGTEEGLPLLPRKTVIDLQYDLARAAQERANAERELERHGLSPKEIDGVCKGAQPPGNQRLWKRALEQNALWGEIEESILRLLPPSDQAHPWSIAAIGELSAAGLANQELADTIRAEPHMSKHFVEVAALLLEGNTVAKTRLLTVAGALDPIMVLNAPAAGVVDWDVAEVPVRAGQRVEAGETAVLLHDPRVMWLRLEPVGEEIGHVVRALEERASLESRPLIAGTGPAMKDLRVDRLETRAGEEERGAVAYVTCRNEALRAKGAADARSWRLRVGLRYLVLVPVERLENRFVLPAGAVTDDGPRKVVFLQDGDTFLAKPVYVEYEDDEIVVVANDGGIFPGDPVALSGAFALGLALQAGSGAAVDPHAGHSHG